VAKGSRVEDLLRAVSVASLGELGVTDAALSGRDARRPGVLVIGSISHAEALGKANRRAIAAHANPIDAVLAAGSGYRLFEGEVLDFPWKEDAGFLAGEVVIAGRGAIANPDFHRGQLVTVLGFPAPAIWRTPAGLEVFGPAYFGFGVPYVPIEQRQR
jgi:uncharacterized protein